MLSVLLVVHIDNLVEVLHDICLLNWSVFDATVHHERIDDGGFAHIWVAHKDHFRTLLSLLLRPLPIRNGRILRLALFARQVPRVYCR